MWIHLASGFALGLPSLAAQAEASAPQEVPAATTAPRPDEDVIRLKTELQKKPGQIETVLALSKALFFSERREEALTLLAVEKSRSRRPASREVLQRRIEVLARVFRTSSGQQSYFEACALLLAGGVSEARSKLETLLQQEPHHPDILFRLGQIALIEGQVDTAAILLQDSSRYVLPTRWQQLWLARAEDLRGNPVRADALFSALSQGGEDGPLFLLWRADFLWRTRRQSEALALLRKSSRNASLGPRFWIEVGEWARAQSLSASDPFVGILREKWREIAKRDLGEGRKLRIADLDTDGFGVSKWTQAERLSALMEFFRESAVPGTPTEPGSATGH